MLITAKMNDLEVAAQKFKMIDHASVGMCAIRKDYTVLFWNRCLEDWTRIPRSNIVGTDLGAHFPHLKEPKYRGRIDTIFLGGAPTIFSSQLHKHIFPATLAGGKLRVQHTTVTAVPSFDGNGHYALFAVEDVTELTHRSQGFREMRDKAMEEIELRKRSEGALQEAHDQLERRVEERVKELRCIYEVTKTIQQPQPLADIFHDLIALIPSAWRYPEITCARIVFGGEQYTSEPFNETEWKQTSDIFIDGVRSGSVEVYYMQKRPAQDEGPFVKEERRLLDSMARVIGEAIERKKAEEERHQLQTRLQQAQKMEAIGTLAGGIAHDFNNILSAILGYTEMTGVALPQGHEAHETLEQVLKASHRAKDLVAQILAFSRQSEQEKKPTNLSLIVKEVLKLLRASLPSTIEIRQEITTDKDTVIADPVEIHQVLMNLCTNAHHAMTETGGVLEVTLTPVDLDADEAASYPDLRPGPYVRLTVSDTGHGIDRAIVGQIFDPYFTTKEKGVGTGLGLAVVDGIVKSHGGAITLRSQPGKGSTFDLFFPLVEMEAAPVTETVEQCPRGSECILFVDDEEPLADLGRRMLHHLGYDVISRSSSVEALEAFRAQPDKFDLVVTDQTMPNMTGEMLAKKIMGIRSDIPIILCTGYSEVIREEHAKAIGIRTFVMKPIVLKEIARTVRRVLDE